MDCKTFTEQLPGYLAGELNEEIFGLMVEHEVECDTCGLLAAAAMSEMRPGAFDQAAAPQKDNKDWLAETLERTIGADCRYIENQIAATLDGETIDALTRKHIDDCNNCQAMVSIISALPDYYAAYPRLRADRQFVKEVMSRTIGNVPSMWEIFRSLIRRPEAILEGALACALIAAPFAGDMPTQVLEKANTARKAIVEQVGLHEISAEIDRKLIEADKHFREIKSQRNSALKTELTDARDWARQQVDQAGNTVDYLTDTDPSTGSPTARVLSWTECALGHVGLINETEENTTDPNETSGTQ